MITVYVTASRTVSYKETTTKKITLPDNANIEEFAKEIRNGDNILFFDDAKWYKSDSGYFRDGYDMKIDSIKAEMEY